MTKKKKPDLRVVRDDEGTTDDMREAGVQLEDEVDDDEAEAGTDDAAASLAELNARYCAISEGGKEWIASWEADSEGNWNVLLRSHQQFELRYRNRYVIVNGKPKSLGQWWLDHPRRRTALRGMKMMPEHKDDEVHDGWFNLWRGWAIDPKEGDCSLFKKHLKDIIAAGDTAFYEYMWNWMAWGVKNPTEPAGVVLVFKGKGGTGKGLTGGTYMSFFGANAIQIFSPHMLFGRFTAHLVGKCVLFADEAIAPAELGGKGRLKGMITEPRLVIEGKGRDAVTAKNSLKIIIASNEDHVVPIDDGQDRFAVIQVSKAHAQDKKYFDALRKELDGGGRAAILHELLNTKLPEGWHPRGNVPRTTALAEQKAIGLQRFEAVMYRWLHSGQIPIFSSDKDKIFVSTRRLSIKAEDIWQKLNRSRQHSALPITDHVVANLMKKLGAEQDSTQSGNRPRGFWLAPLTDMRAAWEREMEHKPNWGDEARTEEREVNGKKVPVPVWEAEEPM